MSRGGSLSFPALREILRVAGPPAGLASYDWRFVDSDPEVAWFVPAPVRFSPATEDFDAILAPPGPRHWLGSDNTGRDVLARMIHGAGVSLLVGFVATGISFLVGVLLGALAGYFGGAVDFAISRLIEVVLCFPTMFLILSVIALLEPSIWKIMVVIGLTSWTTEARFVRGEFLRLREQEFVQAARAMGARPFRIVLRHLLPNSLAPVLVSTSFSVAAAILAEASLSFLGFGVQPPDPSWGNILSQAQQNQAQWWLALFPGMAIFGAVTAYNVVGEALRDAIDPRLHQGRSA
jgi:peptide/nickel transport system permease protein